ncbi:MAG: hypothetical protein ACO2O1_08840 [Candidatus Caldarchaeales archaeon]|jgi:hypothetical protein
MSAVRPAVRPWDYTQQKRDFGQQELQKSQTAPSREASLEQKLREFMRNGEDWERSRTSIPGVFVVKLPGRGSRGPELALEINPVDSQGQPKKKRGYMVRGKADLEELTKIISNPRLTRLAEALEAVNPKAVKNNSRMIEI